MKKWVKVLGLEILVLMWILGFKISILISFLWIILHEAAHIVVAEHLGCTFYKLSISIWGTKAELLEIDDLKEKDKLKVYLAGPVLNLVAAILIYCGYISFNMDFLLNSVVINLCLGVFNLLPAYPLDGARIFEILLSKRFLYKKSKKITEFTSFTIAGLLFLLFNIMLLLHKVNISLFLASILMTYTTFVEKEKTMYIIMGDMVKKARKLKNQTYIENKTISIYYKKGLINVLTLVDKNKFNSFYVLDEDMKLIGIIHEDELIMALKEYGNISLEEYIKIRKKV